MKTMPNVHISLTEKENLLLSAILCVGIIAQGTPEAFDGVQLNIKNQSHPNTIEKYAEACLMISNNYIEVEKLIDKLRKTVA